MAIYNFNYTGGVQKVKLPIGLYRIECWGASGGGNHQSSYAGYAGRGGYSTGIIAFGSETEVNIYVGGQGISPVNSASGGWNGGGNSQSKVNATIDPACSGGGASDVRIGGTSLDNRIIVAGGGGGGGMDGESGGYGGGIIGGDGANNPESGATQTSGYSKGQGQHGNYPDNGYGGPGAGGGYYGGKIHYKFWYGAGGGSGYVDSKLVDAKTISGNLTMPTFDGLSTMVGNLGHGFVKIESITSLDAEFTGKEKEFVVIIPGRYKLEAWGAEGGCGGPREYVGERYYQFRHGTGCSYSGQTHKSNNQTTCSQCGHSCNGPGTLVDTSKKYGSVSGRGGYISGEIYLRKGDVIKVYVGGQGKAGHEANGGAGWNGGGSGTSDRTSIGYGGGGATDFRLNGSSLQDRILVAGGGGGADDYDGGLLGASNDGSGGDGTGASVAGEPRVNGSIQSGYGARNESQNFTLGQGQSASGSYDKAGAGGGYYGGRTTNSNAGGAGGGNGYYNSKFSNVSTAIGNRYGDGKAKITLMEKLMNYQYYAIEINGERFIPSEEYYDEAKDEFIPVSDDILFNPNNSRLGFVTNVKDIFSIKKMKGKEFVPISKFLGGRILKFATIISSSSNSCNQMFNKVTIDMNIDINMYKKTMVEVKDMITLPKEQLSFYLSTNTSDKFRSAINYRGMLLGEYFKDIQYDEIRAYGIEQKNLESYDIPFNEFKVFFKFTDNISDIKENLKYLTIKKKTNESMRRLDFNDLNIKYDGIRDVVNIEMLKPHKEILVNKSNYIEENKSDTLDEF